MYKSFLSLVRLGIGKPVSDLPQSFNWDSLFALAQKQGLSAIILDAVERLPDKLRPSKNLKLQWIGVVLQSFENRFASYENAIGELAAFYRNHSIKMMVLKGYGLSLYYPNPKHRPCGDIDIWNFGKQVDADTFLTECMGINVDNSEHHHTVFYWKDFMVENHYDLLVTTAVKTNKELEPILKELAMDDSNSIVINGERVYLPSANLNALFLLRHMLMHFVACGINLRNFLDWGFFWENQTKNVDTEWLNGLIDRFNMTSFFNIVNGICVDDLGFKTDIFPSVHYNSVLKEKVLKDTLCPEYDWTEAHRLKFFPRLHFKYKRWKSGTWKRELCYNESEWLAFWRSVWSHLIKPSSI